MKALSWENKKFIMKIHLSKPQRVYAYEIIDCHCHHLYPGGNSISCFWPSSRECPSFFLPVQLHVVVVIMTAIREVSKALGDFSSK
jgi:hypothetical protein